MGKDRESAQSCPPAIKILRRYMGETLGFEVRHVCPCVAWADFSRGWW